MPRADGYRIPRRGSKKVTARPRNSPTRSTHYGLIAGGAALLTGFLIAEWFAPANRQMGWGGMWRSLYGLPGYILAAFIWGFTLHRTLRREHRRRVPVSARLRSVMGKFSQGLVIMLFIQLSLGQGLRHVGWSPALLIAHIFLALGVLFCALIIAVTATGLVAGAETAAIRWPAYGLAAWVPGQIILGIFAFALPDQSVTGILHRLSAIILVGLAVMTAVAIRHTLRSDTDENA